MPKSKNISVVNDLKNKVAKASALVLTDYRGLTHKQSEELHRAVKKADGEYIVVKNSLLKLAAKDKFDLTEGLTGTNAALLSFTDEISPLKELTKFSKTTGIPKLKFGFIGGVRYDETQLSSISKLPGKDVLQTMLVSTMSGPIYGLLYTLNGNLNKLVYVLSQIKPEVKN